MSTTVRISGVVTKVGRRSGSKLQEGDGTHKPWAMDIVGVLVGGADVTEVTFFNEQVTHVDPATGEKLVVMQARGIEIPKRGTQVDWLCEVSGRGGREPNVEFKELWPEDDGRLVLADAAPAAA